MVTNCICFGKNPSTIETVLDETIFNFYQPAWYGGTINDGDILKQIQWTQLQLKPYHLHHPLALAYIGLVDNLTALRCQISNKVAKVGNLENSANLDDIPKSSNLKQLIEHSLTIGDLHTDIARMSK